MKKLVKHFVLIVVLIIGCFGFVGCDKPNEPPNNEKPIICSVEDIEKSLNFENYTEKIMFSTSIAKVSIQTQSGLIGLFNMQGEMKQISTSEINNETYDAIRIENIGLWDSTTRRVKITFYNYETLYISEYDSEEILYAEGYIQCGTTAVSIVEA